MCGSVVKKNITNIICVIWTEVICLRCKDNETTISENTGMASFTIRFYPLTRN